MVCIFADVALLLTDSLKSAPGSRCWCAQIGVACGGTPPNWKVRRCGLLDWCRATDSPLRPLMLVAAQRCTRLCRSDRRPSCRCALTRASGSWCVSAGSLPGPTSSSFRVYVCSLGLCWIARGCTSSSGPAARACQRPRAASRCSRAENLRWWERPPFLAAVDLTARCPC